MKIILSVLIFLSPMFANAKIVSSMIGDYDREQGLLLTYYVPAVKCFGGEWLKSTVQFTKVSSENGIATYEEVTTRHPEPTDLGCLVSKRSAMFPEEYFFSREPGEYRLIVNRVVPDDEVPEQN